MQVARLIEPRGRRTILAKTRQMIRAVELEQRYSKDEILALYLALAPFGGNLEGVRAASYAYFGKEPKRLSLGEAALLVALPQSPEFRRPDRHDDAARKARDRVLDRAQQLNLFSNAEIENARTEPVPMDRRYIPARAPQLAEAVRKERPGARLHRLTLDLGLQSSLETLAAERAATIGPKVSVAVLVVDNADGALLASVGGADYLSKERAGALDLTNALRSPGSTLKPFIYGLAFEEGIAHPETLLQDRPSQYGLYAPENFDLTFQGMVSARRALQMSLNVPAVDLLSLIGPQRFLTRLRFAGARLVLPGDAIPGLSVGLGGVGMTLSDLAMLYVGLARGGETIPLSYRLNPVATLTKTPETRRFLDPVAAWYVADVLKGAPPPPNAQAGPLCLQDRHLLWLSRCLGRSALTGGTPSRSGSGGLMARRSPAFSVASQPHRSSMMRSAGSASRMRPFRAAGRRARRDEQKPSAAASSHARRHRQRRRFRVTMPSRSFSRLMGPASISDHPAKARAMFS